MADKYINSRHKDIAKISIHCLLIITCLVGNDLFKIIENGAGALKWIVLSLVLLQYHLILQYRALASVLGNCTWKYKHQSMFFLLGITNEWLDL